MEKYYATIETKLSGVITIRVKAKNKTEAIEILKKNNSFKRIITLSTKSPLAERLEQLKNEEKHKIPSNEPLIYIKKHSCTTQLG